MITRTQKVKKTKAEEPLPETIPEAAPRLIDRLLEEYSTEHLPDTHIMELQGGETLTYKLLKSASQITSIETRSALLLKLCQNREQVKKELPQIVEFLPLDYLTLRDAVTVQDCLLPPWQVNLPQAVRMAHSCGSLLPDICAEIRRMSEPAAWPKPDPETTSDAV